MGAVIQAAREAQRLTRREVAEALNISDQYLYQVETGRRAAALETLWEIALHLGIDPHTVDPRLASRPPRKSS
jgi:transcriptional regulator with XRE-family HTH domain